MRTARIIASAVALTACGSFGATADPVDGGSTEGGAGEGGSIDGGGAGDGSGASRFCNSSVSAKLCEDFDDADNLASPFDFDTESLDLSGKVSAATDVARSAPRSALATLTAGGRAWLEKRVPGLLPTRLTVDFAFRVVDYDAASTDSGHFIVVGCTSNDDQEIYLEIDNANLDLGIRQVPGALDGTFSSGLRKNTWAKVALVLDKSATAGYQVTVTIDDVRIVNKPSDALTACPQGDLTVRLGARASDAAAIMPRFTFGFDDVLIDWK